jgi:uncharacterized OB-fold protein
MPNITPETRHYWESAASGTLLLCKCQECGDIYHYPRPFCPECFGENIKWVEAEGTGKIHSYTITEEVSGWPDEALPLIIAFVELTEGVQIMSNIIRANPDSVGIDAPVEVQFIKSENRDIAIPVFNLVE